jgi:MoaA/NifB/PqqE/SkfB family radical SAM enzyme
MKILFKLTANCNYTCRHCYGSYGPGGRTMTKPQIEQAINHLPGTTLGLAYTGGEVSTRMKELEYALTYAAEQRPNRFPDIKLAVETSGSWLTDENSAFKFLSNIAAWGAQATIITGIDVYHVEQGLKTSMFDLRKGHSSPLSKALQQLRKIYGKQAMQVHLDGAYSKLMPFGRALGRPLTEVDTEARCELPITWQFTPQKSVISIAPDGNVYLCPWSISPSIGSAFEEPIGDLVAKALTKNSLNSILLLRGPIAAAREAGLPIPGDIEEADSYSCYACNQIFSAAREKWVIG